MQNLDTFLFFDIEWNPSTDKVREFGFVLADKEHKGPYPNPLLEAFEEAKYVVGHNILDHDLPVLSRLYKLKVSEELVLDTLLLSSLLFPLKPFHALRKEYIQSPEEAFNPLLDALLVKKLLLECVKKWDTYAWQLQILLWMFLRKETGLAPFFNLVTIKNKESREAQKEVQQWFQSHYRSKICFQKPFQEEWKLYKVEWAFLLALFFEEGESDFLPHWIQNKYPALDEILKNRRLVSCKNKNCAYCSKILDPKVQLKKYFNYTEFRRFSKEEETPLQEIVVQSAMDKKSFLAVFPTGGGKSLTFQLPALIAGDLLGALTVIISPIQALMKDQVDVLSMRHQIDQAVYINSMLSPLERAQAFEDLYEAKKNILYIAPESLRSESIFKLLSNRRIERFVLDEAHCFSSWGHDFRVDYLYVADFIKDLMQAKNIKTGIPVSCFTATAKKTVIQDIQNYFKTRLDLDLELFSTDAKRNNLTYEFLPASVDAKDRQAVLLNVLKEVERPKIVYSSTVADTVKVSSYLKEHGLRAAAYNGQMDTELKIQLLEDFQNEEVDTVVATTAFGMGVDKDNVGLVAHYKISSTLENYVQETGRAGRDPNIQAHCVTLYNEADLNSNFQLLHFSTMTHYQVSSVWRYLSSLAKKQKKITMSALEIADKCGWTEKEENMQALMTKVRTAILILEEQGFLYRKRNKSLMYATSSTVHNVEEARKKLGGDAVDVLGSDENIAFRIIRLIISKRWTREPECSLDELLHSLGLERKAARSGLRLLRSKKMLEAKNDLSLKVTHTGPFTSKSVLNRSKELKNTLLTQFQDFQVGEKMFLNLSKLNSMIESSANTTRKNLFVLRGILRYLAHESVADIRLIEAGRQIYQIEFLIEVELLSNKLEKSWSLFEKLVDVLLQKSVKNDPLVWTSIDELVGLVYEQEAISSVEKQKNIEFALLFLHSISSIVLDKGLLVFYNAMQIEVNENKSNLQFKEEDFALIEQHYQKKAEAIHAVGEYSRLMIEGDTKAAEKLLGDYFIEDPEVFRMLYLGGIDYSTMASSALKNKIEDVDEDQRKVIRSRMKHILVAAGPGSGKTHLLVHKAASLIWLEKTKPDSILMLTFTRAAAKEIKKRLLKLAGPLAYSVNVSTFHALAFSILGLQGSKESLSKGVISSAVELIKSGEELSLGVPSVILVDEFQDLSKDQYELLKVLYNLGEKEPRVIIVGDDDQSIFAFRGGNPIYFRHFEDEFSRVQKHFLTKNYRSLPKIVNSSNILLKELRHRVKSDLLSVSQKSGAASLSFYEEKDPSLCSYMAAFLAEKQLMENPDESCAILSFRNQELYLTAAKLEDLKMPYRLIKGSEMRRFNLAETRELNYFIEYISKQNTVGKRPWSFQEFNNLLLQVQKKYKNLNSPYNWDLLLKIGEEFLKEEKELDQHGVVFSSFMSYLQETVIEDFSGKNKNLISVGTMHSAKGLEFDHVFLSLGDWSPDSKNEDKKQEDFRLLYTACTRAKKSICVLGHSQKLPKNWLETFTIEKFSQKIIHPTELSVELSLKDIDLGFYLTKKAKKNQEKKQKTSAKTKLNSSEIEDENVTEKLILQKQVLQDKIQNIALREKFKLKKVKYNNYALVYDGEVWAYFSKSFRNEVFDALLRKQMKPVSAVLDQVVRWRSDQGEEVWVPLFKVLFKTGSK